MNIYDLPVEILVLTINNLCIEDQFNLALACRKLQEIIANSDQLCRAGLEVEHRFSPEYQEAQRTGDFAKAWRRCVKRRTATRTASPFQACLLAFADQFIFSNGALMYKPAREEIRILFLDGSAPEELHIDTTNILAEARRLFACECRPHDIVEPYHYDFGVATFLVKENFDGHRCLELLVADIHQRTLLSRASFNATTSGFVRNTERYLWIGEYSILYSESPRWNLRMLDLTTQVWGEPRLLPATFSGTVIGQDICFEIIDGFFYGIQSKVDETMGCTMHHIFRMPAAGGTGFERGYCNIDQGDGHRDCRFNELKLVKDAGTGRVWVYEVQKMFLSQGYSERVCHRYCVSLDDPNKWQERSLEPFQEPPELLEAHDTPDTHWGYSGLSIHDSDHRTLLVHAYDAATRTFLDVVKEPSSRAHKAANIYLRSKAHVDDESRNHGVFPESRSLAFVWPSTNSQRVHHSSLQAVMNPAGATPDEAQWYVWNGLLVFSPSTRESDELKPIVLLSFDPGLHVPGLRQECPSSTESLMSLPERMETEWHRGLNWIAKVKPFHLVIRSLEKEHRCFYGLDFGYCRWETKGVET